MNIKQYMKHHETALTKQLFTGTYSLNELKALKKRHERTVGAMQHERLIHLMVTLSFGVFLLITLGLTIVHPYLPVLILFTLFFILLIPYVAHYFFLENTIQRWYALTDAIDDAIVSHTDNENNTDSPPASVDHDR